MSLIATPRLLIAGAAPGVGKSFFTLGLAIALARKKLSVNVCMHTIRFPQAVLYRRQTRRNTRILDADLLNPGQMLEGLRQACFGSDIVLIDGHHGLYDGRGPGTWVGSDAWFAELFAAPVVLVTDGAMFGASLGALVRGFADAAGQRIFVDGVVVNWTEPNTIDGKDRLFFDAALSSFQCPPLVGAMHSIGDGEQLPVHGIAQDLTRTLMSRQFQVALGDLVSQTVDLDLIVEIANRAPVLKVDEGVDPSGFRCKIAVSDDPCFNLCFPDNIDLLKCNGAEIVPFSPLADDRLPRRVGAVYLTGAYLNEYGVELASNLSMREALREFVARGGVVYAEGGGAAFLFDQYVTNLNTAPLPGVGIIPGIAIAAPRSPDFVYLQSVDSSILGGGHESVRGVDSVEWEVGMSPGVLTVLEFSDPPNRRPGEGFSPYANVLASFSFLHWGSNPDIARRIVEAAEVAARNL